MQPSPPCNFKQPGTNDLYDFQSCWTLQRDQEANGSAKGSLNGVSTSEHAAWEMFEANAEANDNINAEMPTIDEHAQARLMDAILTCLADDRNDLFVMAPEPDDSFPTAGGGKLNYFFLAPKIKADEPHDLFHRAN